MREVEGSLGSSPLEGVIRGIPSACDLVLRSARGSLQVLAPSDQGLRPLRRCDPLYVMGGGMGLLTQTCVGGRGAVKTNVQAGYGAVSTNSCVGV